MTTFTVPEVRVAFKVEPDGDAQPTELTSSVGVSPDDYAAWVRAGTVTENLQPLVDAAYQAWITPPPAPPAPEPLTPQEAAAQIPVLLAEADELVQQHQQLIDKLAAMGPAVAQVASAGQ